MTDDLLRQMRDDKYGVANHIRRLSAENAELRRLMRKHQYRIGYCVGCGNDRADGCTPDCEIGRALGKGPYGRDD